MKYIQLIIIFTLISSLAQSQIVGSVNDENESPMIGVNVYWLGTTTGSVTDESGKFLISEPTQYPANLVLSFVGYSNDTVAVNSKNQSIEVRLTPSIELEEFEVVEREDATKLNTMSSLNVEEISAKELTKAACCNLSESFETNASVDVVMSDAVSGAKKIQMLGLDGIYTQLMFENIPNVRGLSSTYGLSFIPGTWIESIQITKGTGSVVNGYEPVTGQINLEYLKPDEAEKLYLNVYGNTMGRAELNLHAGKKFNGRWSTMLFAHGSNMSIQNDYNKDGFMDNPMYSQINVFNRWKNVTKKRISQFGFKVLYDDKLGGQVDDFSKLDFTPVGKQFVVGVNSKQYEVFGKTGFLLPAKPNASIGLLFNAKRHEQFSFFGNQIWGDRNYNGVENSVYFNAIYQGILGTTDHGIKTGLSFIGDDFNESFNDSSFVRTEIVPGAFAEYTYSKDKVVSLVLGVRGDYHNLYGFFATPRAHFKWNFKERSVFRLTGGKGFRTPNVIVENAAVFASSRTVKVREQLLPEEAWNVGASVIHKFTIGEMESSISADYYYTYFTNQAVVDLDYDVDEVLFYNLDGLSYSHSFQVDVMIEPIERLEFKFAYKHYDVRTTYHGILLQKPLVPTDRGLVNVGYETANTKWQFDVNAKIFGKSRLPNTEENPDTYELESYSDEFFTLNGQITRRFRRFEYYVGTENVLNYKQPNAIIAADDPFGEYFDASMIYGPVNGRVIYGGLRLKIE